MLSVCLPVLPAGGALAAIATSHLHIHTFALDAVVWLAIHQSHCLSCLQANAVAANATSHLLTVVAAEAVGRLAAGLTPAVQRVLASSALAGSRTARQSPVTSYNHCCQLLLPAGSALAVIATSHLLTELAGEADGRLIAGLTPAAQGVLASSALHILQERLDNAAAAVALADGHLGGDGETGDSIHGSPMHAPDTPWQLIGNGLVMRELPVGHETLDGAGAEAGSQEAAPGSEVTEELATSGEQGPQNCRHIELQTGVLLQKHLSMPLAASAPAH